MHRKAFISHSHSDRDMAERVATALRSQGVDAWLDKWEILPGDSLVQKVMFEGLQNCDVFLVLLSPDSTASKWVYQELDMAMIQRLENVTRIIPLIVKPCEIPLPLRTLLWVDLTKDFDEGVRKVVKAIHGVSDKPPLGLVPSYISELQQSVGGLSGKASRVGATLIHACKALQAEERGYEPYIQSRELRVMFPHMTNEEIDDAVDELLEYGLVQVERHMGGDTTFSFQSIAPTYALYHTFSQYLDYSPEDDLRSVACAIAAVGEMDGSTLEKATKLPPNRINKAISYLEDYGLLDVEKWMGTVPYAFGSAIATRKTRDFVENNCR